MSMASPAEAVARAQPVCSLPSLPFSVLLACQVNAVGDGFGGRLGDGLGMCFGNVLGMGL